MLFCQTTLCCRSKSLDTCVFFNTLLQWLLLWSGLTCNSQNSDKHESRVALQQQLCSAVLQQSVLCGITLSTGSFIWPLFAELASDSMLLWWPLWFSCPVKINDPRWFTTKAIGGMSDYKRAREHEMWNIREGGECASGPIWNRRLQSCCLRSLSLCFCILFIQLEAFGDSCAEMSPSKLEMGSCEQNSLTQPPVCHFLQHTTRGTASCNQTSHWIDE